MTTTYDSNTEKELLGAILRDPKIVPAVLEILPDHRSFRDLKIGAIYGSIIKRDLTNQPIDITLLMEDGHSATLMAGMFDDFYGIGANWKQYAEAIKDRGKRRWVKKTAEDLAKIVTTTKPLSEAVHEAEAKLSQISMDSDVGRVKPVGDVMDGVIQRLIDYETKTVPEGTIFTGLKTIDDQVVGFEPSNFVLIAGWTGQGKSLLADAIAVHNAVEKNIPVLMFSLEMSYKELGIRQVLRLAKVDANTAKYGEIKPDQWDEISKQDKRLRSAPLYLHTGPVTTAEIRAISKRYIAKHGVQLIFVDTVQLVPQPGIVELRPKVAKTSADLKLLAMELDVPIIGVSQLTLLNANANPRPPTMKDVNESKNLAQDPNIIMFCYHGHVPGIGYGDGSWVLVGKQRMGVGANLKMSFGGGRWNDLSMREEN